MKNASCVLILLSILCGACQKKEPAQPKFTRPAAPKAKISSALKKTAVLLKAPKNMPSPELGSTVLVHYTGWLANPDHSPGKQIDSSVERKKPLEFVVGLRDVIKGMEQGVMLMHVGEKSRFVIPPELAYGEHGVGFAIPPHATLIFEIELLAMK